MPLALKGRTAALLAIEWQQALNAAKAKYPAPMLRVEYQTAPVPRGIRPASPQVSVDFTPRPSAALGTETFDAVILAAGAGPEDRTINPAGTSPCYEGEAFWGPRTFLRSTLPDNPRVVISGAGDGSLQDYLHVMTNVASASDLYNQLVPDRLRVRRIVEATIQSAEDRAQRGRCWARDKHGEEPYLAELQKVHQDQIDLLLRETVITNRLRAMLDANDAHPVRPKVILVTRGPTLTANYALNRFLTLLIVTYLERHSSDRWKTWHGDARIVSITPSDPSHHCLGDYAGISVPSGPKAASGRYGPDGILVKHACHGTDHTVQIEGFDGLRQSYEANVIIVRHGPRNGVGTPWPAGRAVNRPRRLSRSRHSWLYHLA